MDFNYDINAIIINLEVIGKLDVGSKLSTRGKHFNINPAGITQCLIRYKNWDDREITYEKIKLLIQDVQKLIDPSKSYFITLELKNINDFYEYIHKILTKAFKGMSSLLLTYDNDKMFISKIQIELDKLKRLIEDTNKNIQQ